MNQQPVRYEGESSWVDISFKKIDISKLVKSGNNVIEIQGKVGIEAISTPSEKAIMGSEIESCYVRRTSQSHTIRIRVLD